MTKNLEEHDLVSTLIKEQTIKTSKIVYMLASYHKWNPKRSTRKEMCTEFEKMMHKKFQMSSMGELTFFLGLVNTLRSGEDRLKLKELMELCTKLSNRVLNLETTKNAQAKEIANLKKRVKRLERKRKSRSHRLKRLYKVVLSARVESSKEKSLEVIEDITTAGIKETISIVGLITTVVTIDELTLAQALVELKTASTRPKEKSIVMQEPSKTPKTTTIPVSSKVQDKDKEEEAQKALEANIVVIEQWHDVQAKIDADYELAQMLQAKEQEQLTDAEKARLFMEFLKKKRKFFTAKRAKEKKNKPPTKAQQRILMNMDTKVVESTKKEKEETVQESSSKRVGDEQEQEKSKKQTVENDKEKEELKRCLKIIPDDRENVTIDATYLSTKSLTVVDYKIYKEGRKSFFQIFRADGNSQMYLTFSKLLKNFIREDLEVLWRFVKDRFVKTKLVDDMDSFLMHTLKTMFEHHVKDTVWKIQ
uniref:Uncharacterized protein n=1 Tax=Tanacetum cinerariifolium TaxID=118510 RepID=A0A6L2LX46_TANCI|nr:hypothetical protein [Tanacetum cinerariifolium]